MKHILNLSMLIFLCCIFSISAQSTTATSKTLINDIVAFYQFENIRDYVMEYGNMKEFCTNSGDCPHLMIENFNTEIYFLNYSTKMKPESRDYNVMYIVTDYGGSPAVFYVYMADNAKVYLYDYNNIWKDESDKRNALEKLNSSIKNIRQYIIGKTDQ